MNWTLDPLMSRSCPPHQVSSSWPRSPRTWSSHTSSVAPPTRRSRGRPPPPPPASTRHGGPGATLRFSGPGNILQLTHQRNLSTNHSFTYNANICKYFDTIDMIMRAYSYIYMYIYYMWTCPDWMVHWTFSLKCLRTSAVGNDTSSQLARFGVVPFFRRTYQI